MTSAADEKASSPLTMRSEPTDGVTAMVPREQMSAPVRKLRDFYARVPGAPLYRREFSYYCLERWHEQGLDRDADLAEVFGYDGRANHGLGQLGGCEAAFCPTFEEKVIEDRGDHEVVRDTVGRHVLCFKGRRSGFMPEYLDHPVKDVTTWQERCKWRMDPAAPARYADLDQRMAAAQADAARGMIICQNLVGGYMLLRSLIGPLELMVIFHDQPELIHDCMRAWLALADGVIARHQQYVTLDEIRLDEDICFNHGALISPEMIRRFLFPYYQQLLSNVKARQIDRGRHLYVNVDSDGYAPAIIPLYAEAIGMDVMFPFEVAAGCEVVALGRQFPLLAISGGIDKRVLAAGKPDIDRHVEAILPPLRRRGGYCPTCDHGVPEEVSLDNYLHYRKRCIELGG